MDIPNRSPAGDGIGMRLIGGPTAMIEYLGLRLLTDPAFDAPGPIASGNRTLVKTAGPAVPVEEIGAVDAVLLSHDHHADNLDRAGRALLAHVPLTLTTPVGAERLGGTASGMPVWQHADLDAPGGRGVRVTAVPAQHGPDGTDHITGPVTGFVLTADDAPTVYVSGDNASLDVVKQVADRFAPVDVAVLFAGAARTPLVDGYLTLTAEQAAEAARLLRARTVVPVHAEGWQHFTEGPDDLRAAFARQGLDTLLVLAPGESATL
ncbi:MBL fold metallo-hydrolase [Streptomyces sp. NPDC002018]|uniref:MBL fold metallo-hydrolase n=1 Tax=Streptomyces sp. NPDC002018 TaxID=3364629 RepID=UPI0036C0D45F